ncbi:class I adenylate-forming enzyme family protein [Sciscionella marina]|uniref:class I adenylate-forming enzyme family protein n=1 Tax=Sciscionella marina TaxID=508770 RepID=UPI000381FFD9|nr:AMP-binding protein [Sciscionella marina]
MENAAANSGFVVRGPHLDYPDAPVWALLEGARTRWPEQVALQSEDERITWSELAAHARALAAAWERQDLPAGTVIALHLGNSIEFAIAYWAAQYRGLTVTPVNPQLPVAEVREQLADSAAEIVISTSTFPGLRCLPVDSLRSAPPAPHEWAPHRPADLASAIAHISYTGGTTGTPKGVAVSQRNIVCNALQFCSWSSGSVPDRALAGNVTERVVLEQTGSTQDFPVRLGTATVIAVAPWFHAMGLIGGLVVPALQGSRSILIGRFEVQRFVETVEAESVTSVSGAPALLAALTAFLEQRGRGLPGVRLVSCGGGPLPVPLAERLSAVFPDAVVTQAYGLTEVSMAAVGNPIALSAERFPGSVGIPLPDTEVSLIPVPGDTTRDGRGEIAIRGPQVMLGYHGHPQETAQVLRDGWLHTGDVGIVDERGYLHIVDRTKDMLIYKGYNVYPSELERLLRSCPGVRDAAVVGVPDPEAGDLPVAFVVPDGKPPDPGALTEQVNGQVVHYKKLRGLFVVDTFPTSAVGKTRKTTLREMAGERLSNATG